ncbi:RibD family protein [Roseinatronobacter monicus]|uniref:Riboflavin-specific deaminase-like protein n=1 Tax=Roseinatronobacter monicus TaxID=393481 RepID=A0A543K9B9_9RHOB|nr:RibD family protein [Roseinatronobacter monicus]TQM91642.1 riboflavin-specific deaminase-like protein [Roseinatronobacter monicus]
MHSVTVTRQVWDRVLAVRSGHACACCGVWSEGEKGALALYGPLARRDLTPMVVAQIGQSLDGRVATVSGDARDVSGPDGLAHLHRLRALVDGVVIGVGTALHDNSRLTVRLCSGPNPARIVIDPKGRLPDDAPALRADGARRLVVQAVERPRIAGVEVIRLPLVDGIFRPRDILSALQKSGLSSLLIEGGGITIAGFLEAGLLTRLQVAVAPLLIGAGPASLTTKIPHLKLADCIRPDTRVFGLGSDVLFDCGLSPDASAATLPIHAPAPTHAHRSASSLS